MARDESDFERLRRLIGGQESTGLDPFFTVVEPGKVMFEGTSVPILGATPVAQQKDLLVPEGGRTRTDPVGAYLKLGDYLDLEEDPVDHRCLDIDVCQRSHSCRDVGSAVPSRQPYWPAGPERRATRSIQYWNTDVQSKLSNALRHGEIPRTFLARQPILAAIRYVLELDPDVSPPPQKFPPLFAAILLTHAMAMTLEASGDDTG
jgi:hypothetical protein